MRINLDDPTPEKSGVIPVLDDESQDDDRVTAQGADELIIRRDQPQKRRRSGPRPLTQGQQRALLAFLIVVISIAVIAFGSYLRNAYLLTRRLPELPDAPARTRPSSPTQAAPQIQRPAGRPVYEGPPPVNTRPLAEPDPADDNQPTEGIH
ncbi:MAG: hypothetical protein HUU17_03940 [Chthonomonadales bacterium]|nr:hypothetical protein [Chthonomonadales bacterium]